MAGFRELPGGERESKRAVEGQDIVVSIDIEFQSELEADLATGVERVYREIELPLVWTLSDMEKAGVKILPEISVLFRSCRARSSCFLL